MAINLLDMVQSQLGGAAMSQIGKFLGEDESKAAAGMGAAIPTFLAAVLRKGSSESGASDIMDLLKTGGYNGSMFDKLGALLGGGTATNGLISTGGSLLDFFMDNQSESIIDLIIRHTGLGKDSTETVLKMAAPMVIGMIGKQVNKSGMNASGLMSLLKDQKDFLKKALPAGMGSLLGFTDMGEDYETVIAQQASRETVPDSNASASGKSLLSRLLPLALIAILAFLGYRYFTGGNNIIDDATTAVSNAADKTADMAGDAADNLADATSKAAEKAAGTVADAAEEAMNPTTKAAPASLANVTFAPGSAGEKLVRLLNSGKDVFGEKVAFKNLDFKTGTAEIEPGTEVEIENLAAVLKAYPKLNVEIGGHTDNQGDPANNLQLSNARAGIVAKMLVRQYGVDRNRVSAFGFGDGQPVGDNKTEAGRAANRRIEVLILE